MWSLVVELLAKAIEGALLGATVGCRWSRGFSFQSAMHSFMTTILLWFAGLDQFGHDARRTNQAERVESLASETVAKGTPLSVRMRWDKPNS
jgi:hypothetical protein